jgi:hypothetical protein
MMYWMSGVIVIQLVGLKEYAASSTVSVLEDFLVPCVC